MIELLKTYLWFPNIGGRREGWDNDSNLNWRTNFLLIGLILGAERFEALGAEMFNK